MHSFIVEEHDAALRYVSFPGQDIPLVMLHGLGCASTFEYPAVVSAEPLRDRHTVLVDLFGSGYSDHPASFGYRVGDHAAAVVALINALPADQIDLYGHSMGGSIAIEVASRLGDTVRALAVSEANLDPGGGEFSTDIASVDEDTYCLSQHALTIKQAIAGGNSDWAATMRVSDPRSVYFGAVSLVEGSEPTWREQLYDLAIPRSFIFGEQSLPDPDVDELGAHGIDTMIVAGAGHSMSTQNPLGLAECLANASSLG